MLNLSNFAYYNEPFEYCESKNTFNKEFYIKLSKTFPKLDKIQKEIDEDKTFSKAINRIDINLKNIEQIYLDKIWLDLINSVTSIEYFYELCDKLNIKKENYKTISPRHLNKDTDIFVDFQFAYNIKNEFKYKQFIRPPHVDSTDKLIVILIYFPEKNDDQYVENDYGYLQLYDTTMKNFKKIEYKNNHAIIIKNSANAFHAPYTLLNHKDENRRFVNIVYMKNELFKI
jgi:hypothetical protein